MTFDARLSFGKAGESHIAMYFRGRGFGVLPVYEKTDTEKKGPQIFLPVGSLISPDLLVFRNDRVFWIEAKHKTAFSWHRMTSQWVTGIDRRHFSEYLQVAQQTPWPVWLVFLHIGGAAKDSPTESPAGLFGNDIRKLALSINHQHDGWGASGMVYWAIDSLILIAPLSAVMGEKNTDETSCRPKTCA